MNAPMLEHTGTLNQAPPATIAASFPVQDVQFWIVTFMFLAALAWIFRGVFRRGGRSGKRGKTTRVSLTVGGKSPATPSNKSRSDKSP